MRLLYRVLPSHKCYVYIYIYISDTIIILITIVLVLFITIYYYYYYYDSWLLFITTIYCYLLNNTVITIYISYNTHILQSLNHPVNQPIRCLRSPGVPWASAHRNSQLVHQGRWKVWITTSCPVVQTTNLLGCFKKSLGRCPVPLDSKMKWGWRSISLLIPCLCLEKWPSGKRWHNYGK